MAQAGFDTARKLLRIGVYAALVLAPLPFGSVQAWAVLGLQLLAAALALVAAWCVFREPRALPVGVKPLWAPATVLAALALVQLVPVPQGVVRALARPTAQARAEVAAVLPETAVTTAPNSLSPPDTVDAVLRGAAGAIFLVVTAIAFRERSQFRRVAALIAACAAFQALYGVMEYLSQHQHIFLYAKKHYLDSASGTFINRNHYATYLAMGLPFALGPLIDARADPFAAGPWRQRLVRLTEPANLRAILGASAAFVIWIGVFLSYSRGGLAAAVVATAVLAVQGGSRRRLWTLAAICFLAVAMLSWMQVNAPGERFLDDPEELTRNVRLPVWAAGASMIPLYPVAGTGFGTFESAFRMYQPSSRQLFGHAHSDWLEWAIEGGVLMPAIALWILWLVLRASRRARTSSSALVIHRCALASVAAVVFHCLLDFPLRIPALAVLLACVLGLMCAEPADAGDVRPIVRSL